jgi:predicted transcriptional regulator
MDCPVCGFTVADLRGLATHFRHQPSTHPNYAMWAEARAWEGKVEGADFVKCRECGFRASSLARHLGSVHGFSADEYREKHGADSPIRCDHTESKRRAGIKAAHARADHKGQTKTAPCTACGEAIEIALFAAAATAVCEVCRNSIWDGKTEPKDFVTCLDCGYRAENLTSHLLNAHPDYRSRHPDALVVALCSSVRDKTALQGRTLSSEVRARMSANAGRWNKGLTKEAHPSLMAASEKMRGRPSWSSGLTAATDARLQQTVAKLKHYAGENRPWSNGLKADLTLADFQPFLDAEGCVDRRLMEEATGLSWNTLYTYMQSLDLETSFKYVRERAEEQTIRLGREVLEQSLMANGKISVARVMRDTGHSFSVVKRECARHGLDTFTRNGEQTLVLDAISEALGGKPYHMEWRDTRFVNPVTGHRFKYDGYFPDVNLVVEYQGHQHYLFPNAFYYKPEHKAGWHEMLERDRVKRELVGAAGGFTYLEVRFDDPLTSVDFFQGVLRARGLL